eukprot:m51a1_g12570 hypothetical protein (242) ;mRNA; f:131-1467
MSAGAPPSPCATPILVEYSPDNMRALEEFRKADAASRAMTPQLEAVLVNIAKTGQSCYPWELIQPLLVHRCDEAMRKMQEARGWKGVDPDDTYQRHREEFLASLRAFPAAPFTLQRLCELVTTPSPFARTRSYLFALEKMVSVCTTQEHLTPDAVAQYNRALEAAAAAAAAKASEGSSGSGGGAGGAAEGPGAGKGVQPVAVAPSPPLSDESSGSSSAPMTPPVGVTSAPQEDIPVPMDTQ